MNCDFCGGTGGVSRVRVGGDSEAFMSVIGKVTCPKCIRGLRVLGTHEMLRGHDGLVHQPGELIYTDMVTGVEFTQQHGGAGTIRSGLVSVEVGG